jgi:hypothetical protein
MLTDVRTVARLIGIPFNLIRLVWDTLQKVGSEGVTPYHSSDSQGPDKVVHIFRGYDNRHRNGHVVGDCSKSLM